MKLSSYTYICTIAGCTQSEGYIIMNKQTHIHISQLYVYGRWKTCFAPY